MCEENDLISLKERVAESEKLFDRIHSTICARVGCAQVLAKLQRSLAPITEQVAQFAQIVDNEEAASKEMMEECNNIGVELVDCLKVAIEFDTLAQTGHIHFKDKGNICVAKQLIAAIDARVESILAYASKQNEATNVISAAFDNLKRRAADFADQMTQLRNEMENVDLDGGDFNAIARQVQQAIDSVTALRKIELKAIKLKARVRNPALHSSS